MFATIIPSEAKFPAKARHLFRDSAWTNLNIKFKFGLYQPACHCKAPVGRDYRNKESGLTTIFPCDTVVQYRIQGPLQMNSNLFSFS
jgi:hypothetical protein